MLSEQEIKQAEQQLDQVVETLRQQLRAGKHVTACVVSGIINTPDGMGGINKRPTGDQYFLIGTSVDAQRVSVTAELLRRYLSELSELGRPQ
jgi:Flp pilus assembly protein TadB